MHIKKIIRKNGSYLPAGEWEPTSYTMELKSTPHSVLRRFLRLGCRIQLCLDEITIYVRDSILWVRLFDDHIKLEYICTCHGLRRQGSARHAITRLVSIADDTGTTLKLATNMVLKLKGESPAHIAIVQGVKGENRIPGPQLTRWLQGFGFIEGTRSEDQGFDYRGCNMHRLPKEKINTTSRPPRREFSFHPNHIK